LTRAAAALAVPVVALAACGGTTTSDSLEDAAKETAESSSRIEMSYESTDGSFRGSMSGAFDYANERAHITDFQFVEKESFTGDEPQPKEVRALGETDYLRYQIDGKTYWVKERATRDDDPYMLLFPIPGSAHDPSDVFSMVLRASSKITNLGLERVRGDEATHYRASVDVKKLAEEVPAAQRDDFLSGMQTKGPLPVDVWVDDESRLRRVRMREQFIEDVGLVMEFELFDFGVEVDVEAPPADQVITEERFDELTSPSAEELEALCREEAPKGEANEYCEETGVGE
jgi:hypothetical protein